MPICSYLVVPAADRMEAVMAELAALDGCEAVRADNRPLIALVTDTPDAGAEAALRRALEQIEGILALVLTFGELAGEEAAR